MFIDEYFSLGVMTRVHILCLISDLVIFSVIHCRYSYHSYFTLRPPLARFGPRNLLFFFNCFVAYPFHVETAKITTDLREGLVRLTLPRFNFYCKDKIIVRCGLTDFCSIVTSLSPSFFFVFLLNYGFVEDDLSSQHFRIIFQTVAKVLVRTTTLSMRG